MKTAHGTPAKTFRVRKRKRHGFSGRSLLACLALSCVLQAADPARASDDPAVGAEAVDSWEHRREEVSRAAEAGEWARVRSFLASVRPGDDPAVHLFAGNLLFAVGFPDRAYREHVASARGALETEGRYETTLDLLALRRFPEACDAYAKLPRRFRSSGKAGIAAYMELRCGNPKKALKQVRTVFQEGHSSAEEELAGIFSEQKRFSFFRDVLEESSRAHPSPSTTRALGELLLCGDLSNPWSPRHDEEGAAARFRSVLRSRPEDCLLQGRSAIAEMLVTLRASGRTGAPVDFAKAHALLSPAFENGPGCEETAEAYSAYLDLTSDDGPSLIETLEGLTQRFPASGLVHRSLMDRYREAGIEKEHRAVLEAMVRKFPDDPFGYSRLAVLDAIDGKEPEALVQLQRGLDRMPDSLPLNSLAAALRIKNNEFKRAVGPATRVLAALMETRNYHHDWEPGMELLAAALEGRSVWPAEKSAVTALLNSFDLQQQAQLFRSSYGCFSSGGGSVAVADGWYRPEVVVSAVKTSLDAGAPPSP